MSDYQISCIKSYIKKICEIELDEDDDDRVKRTFISIYAKNILRQSKINDNIQKKIINDLYIEFGV